MSRWAAVALIAVLLSAGCLEAGDAGASDPSGSTPPPTSQSSSATSTAPPAALPALDLLLGFGFSACYGLGIRHARPLEDVQALLPSGYTAAPAPETLNPDLGTLAVDVLRCGNLTAAGTYHANVTLGWMYTYIEPPQVPGGARTADVHEYLFRMLTGEDVLAQLWPAAGYDTYTAPAEVNDFQDTGPLRLGFVDLGAYYLLATAVEGPPTSARDATFARYTQMDDGSVLLWTGTYDLPPPARGPGFVELADDDPFLQYGNPQTGRPLLAGTGDLYRDGSLRGLDLRRLF